jgi:hypothetical protein
MVLYLMMVGEGDINNAWRKQYNIGGQVGLPEVCCYYMIMLGHMLLTSSLPCWTPGIWHISCLPYSHVLAHSKFYIFGRLKKHQQDQWFPSNNTIRA